MVAGGVAAEEPGVGGRMRKKSHEPGSSPGGGEGIGEERGLFATDGSSIYQRHFDRGFIHPTDDSYLSFDQGAIDNLMRGLVTQLSIPRFGQAEPSLCEERTGEQQKFQFKYEVTRKITH